ncbi:unnamed protein product [Spodoptera littoralis]|uniref:Cytosolic fatty-acid binding proteins domain-containing protein n=1 Tax=Spodoptera littoralis TaxID=7109 RepID=A0A9P0N3E5_SPOLI|nr:unnamed protein product [Spodoptera littoralis]CAH1641023.1 unnamed protein product [Spodoptera littoralis]
MEFVGKKYKMVSSENFDEFMKAIEKPAVTYLYVPNTMQFIHAIYRNE